MKVWSGRGFSLRNCEYLEPFLLFFSFFLIIATYSVAKPMKGALVVSEFGAASLPFVWLGSAVLIGLFVAVYGRLVDRLHRNQLFASTVLLFGATLVLLRFSLGAHVPGTSIGLYLWGDIFSVVLVEQFWSLTNDLFDTARARRWYGFIASGGVVGGIVGSASAYSIVQQIGTMNLIYVCVAMLSVLPFLVWILPARTRRSSVPDEGADISGGFSFIRKDGYLMGILAVVVLTQVGSTLIDYQFNVLVESAFSGVDARTQFIAQMSFWVSTLSLGMMLISSPIQKYLGVRGGLMVLPLVDFIGTVLTLVFPIPMVSVALKVADKGLNYSTQRISKEILYIPTSLDVKYKVKSVIDMFAYRFSKSITSVLILPFTYLLRGENVSYLTLAVLLLLMAVVGQVSRRYHGLVGTKEGGETLVRPVLS